MRKIKKYIPATWEKFPAKDKIKKYREIHV
jgi:hypothetical protein